MPYPKGLVKVAVDTCVFSYNAHGLQILLVQLKKKPCTGQWALPGGLLHKSEQIDHAAKRLLSDQIDPHHTYTEELYTFSKPKNVVAEHEIAVAYLSMVHTKDHHLKNNPRFKNSKWFNINKVPTLAFGHNAILEYAVKRLTRRISYTNLIWPLLPEVFTLSDLQKIYESLLNRKLDKRNFRKKVLGVKLVKPTNQKVVRGAHRPAELFKFTTKEFRVFEVI